MAAPPKRSETAKEGLALLKRGSTVKKYGRQGKPHATLFRLSDDETLLGWEGRGLNKLKRRAVRICDLVELLVGHESVVFLEARAPGAEHMSMSLRLLKAQRPDDDDRDTLDLSCDDEETFGLWVAALRALLAEQQSSRAAAVEQPAAALRGAHAPQEGQAAPAGAASAEVAGAAVPEERVRDLQRQQQLQQQAQAAIEQGAVPKEEPAAAEEPATTTAATATAATATAATAATARAAT